MTMKPNGTENAFKFDDAVIASQLTTTETKPVLLETGYIDNLQQTYGFVKCNRRRSDTNTELRLFFHKSACSTNFDCLKLGDFVEFEEKTINNKPVATKIKLSDSPAPTVVEGSIISMPKKAGNIEESGSLTYRYNGEHFFLSFNKEDLKEGQKLKVNDEILFEAVQQKTVDHDREVCKVFPVNIQKKHARPERVNGIVSSVKERFGFIERGDMVKEIYFNLTEAPPGIKEGHEVEFSVKHLRNGKEEAVAMKCLPEGTVVFYDTHPDIISGTVLRAPVTRKSADQSPGCIAYDFYEGDQKWTLQLPFNESDRIGGYTLMPGDKVDFRIAIDRRDQLQRAHDVQMNLDYFLEQSQHKPEQRQYGVVRSLSSVLQLNDSNSGTSPYVLIEPDELTYRVGDEQNGRDRKPLLVQFKIREWILPDQFPLLPFTAVTYTPLQVTRQTIEGETYPVITALRVLPGISEVFTNLKLYASGEVTGTIVQPAVGLEPGIITAHLPHCLDKIVPLSFMKSALLPNDSEKVFKVGDMIKCGALVRTDSNSYYTSEAYNITELAPENGDATISSSFLNNSSSVMSNGLADYLPNSDDAMLKNSEPGSEPLVVEEPATVVLTVQKQPEIKVPGRFEKPPPDERKHRSRTLPESRLQDSDKKYRGWITICRDSFGFIETGDYKNLFKFNPGPECTLKPGYEVEFTVSTSRNNLRAGTQKRLADNVKSISKGTLPEDKIIEEGLTGKVLRELTITDTMDSTTQYHGVIEDDKTGTPYPFTMKSLYHFRTKLARDDKVKFCSAQIGNEPHARRACKVTPVNDRLTGKVTSIKADFGYIEYTPVSSGQVYSGDGTTSSTRFIRFDATSALISDIMCRNRSPNATDDKATWTDLNVGDLVNFHLNMDEITNEEKATHLKRARKNSNSEGHAPIPVTRKPYVSQAISTGIRKRYGRQEVDKVKVILVREPRGPPKDKSIGFVMEYKSIPSIPEA